MRVERFFVGGEWLPATRRTVVTIASPQTGEPVGEVPKGNVADVRQAIHAARWAFDDGPWPRMDPGERARILRTLSVEASIDKARMTEIEMLETACTEKAAADVMVAPPVEAISFYADRAAADPEQRIPDAGGTSTIRRRDPRGVVAVIGGGSEPLGSFVHSAVAALAAGNTVVFKPSSRTPLSAFVLAEAAGRAGLPAGALNVVSGPGALLAQEITGNPFVDAIAIDARSTVATKIAGKGKPVIAGNPNGAIGIVLAGAEVGAEELLRVWLRHEGRATDAAQRLVAERKDDVLDSLLTEAKALEPARMDEACRAYVERERRHLVFGDGVAILDGADPDGIPPGPILVVTDAPGSRRYKTAYLWAPARERAFEVARGLHADEVLINGASPNPFARSIEAFSVMRYLSA